MRDILMQYGFEEKDCELLPFGNGLINHTWLLKTKGEEFILQKINHSIFKSPADIAFNIRLVADHLHSTDPGYLFIAPLQTRGGKDLVEDAGEYYRVFPYVKGTHSINVVERPEQAFEAAKQFGKFTKLLAGLDASELKITLPHFHDLSLRYRQFEEALLHGDPERIKGSASLVTQAHARKSIVDEFEYCKLNFKIRCTHHDTKISNILFDAQDRGVCVIDLDTLMPGYFISDLGDMMRTYLSPVSEEESDLSKIEVRSDFYKAIVEGYGSEMGDELSGFEKEHFLYAGKFMIYMQALRFLTDHLNNDIYYGAKYAGHNFVRAANQFTLLQKLFNSVSSF